jgi:hypothetical protein
VPLLAPKPNWYVGNGNMIYHLVDEAGQSLNYDAENRLANVQTSPGSAYFQAFSSAFTYTSPHSRKVR